MSGVGNVLMWKNGLVVVPCPLCHSTDPQPRFERPDGLTIVQCVHCTFCFLSPRPTKEALGHYYSTGYFEGATDFYRGQDYVAQRKQAIERENATGWQFLQKKTDLRGKSLLDLGCADGALLVLARKRGAQRVVGLEPVREIAEKGQRAYGLEILPGTADHIPLESGTMDVVTAFDVIEHVWDPLTVLREIKRVLVAGGLFIGICPNMGCFQFLGDEWVGLKENMEHLNYFDVGALKRLGSAVGLPLQESELFGFPLPLKQYAPGTDTSNWLSKLRSPGIALVNTLQKLRMVLKPRGCRNQIGFVFQKQPSV